MRWTVHILTADATLETLSIEAETEALAKESAEDQSPGCIVRYVEPEL